MQKKVLCVDDEQQVLRAFQRHFMDAFELTTATSGAKALEIVNKEGPFAVVVSDLQMPGMDGIALLSAIREKWPETMRIMLTGKANLDAAIEAVNQGSVFRFLTKPTSAEVLQRSIEEALEVYRLRSVEREMMEQTVKGSINILTDVLSLSNPIAFGRASRVKRLAGSIAQNLGYQHVWEVEIAALLSQVGLVTVPDEILEKTEKRIALDIKEREVMENHPRVAQRLVKHIPRLEKIAQIIANQWVSFNESKTDKTIPTESLILRATLDYDNFIAENKTPEETIAIMRGRAAGAYDPDVLRSLAEVVAAESEYRRVAVSIADLRENMIIAEDVRGNSGVVLIGKGQGVTNSLRSRLLSYAHTAGVVEPIHVYVQDTAT